VPGKCCPSPTVGGISASLGPGTLIVPHQIIDYTWGRPSTYFEGKGTPVQHVDFTEPYSRALRGKILQAARACREKVEDKGVYAATQGPRLESAQRSSASDATGRISSA